MSLLLKKITAGTTAVAATAALLTTAATPAAAATVRVNYGCSVELIVVPVTFDITITAPAQATRGQTATISTTVASTQPYTGAPIPAGTRRSIHDIRFGGAATGTLRVALTNPEIQPGTPVRVTGSAPFTFTTAGTVTFQPGGYGVSEPRPAYGCGPLNPATVPIAATTQVS